MGEQSERMSVMFDANAFNKFASGDLKISQLNYFEIYITSVQRSEIMQIPEIEKRDSFLRTLDELHPKIISAHGFSFDIDGAGYDQADWEGESDLHEKMLERLKELDKKSKKYHENQTKDIIIARTCIKKKFILVTDDRKLKEVMAEFGGRAIGVADLVSA